MRMSKLLSAIRREFPQIYSFFQGLLLNTILRSNLTVLHKILFSTVIISQVLMLLSVEPDEGQSEEGQVCWGIPKYIGGIQ